MRKSVVNSVMSVMNDLHKNNLIDDITMKNIETLALPEIGEYHSNKIASLRKKNRLSQGALARLLNVSPSTVQKWELGAKKPSGAAKKLLHILENRGVKGLV